MKLPEFKMDRLGLVAVILLAVSFGIIVKSWMTPDCPDAVVDTELLQCHNSIDSLRDINEWLWTTMAMAWEDKFPVKFIGHDRLTGTWQFVSAYPYSLADSIAVLKERLDWWRDTYWEDRGLWCFDMVSVAAVDSFIWGRDTTYESGLGWWRRWCEFKQARGL